MGETFVSNITPRSIQMVSVWQEKGRNASRVHQSTPQLQTCSQRLQITVSEGVWLSVASVGVVDISVRFEQ